MKRTYMGCYRDHPIVNSWVTAGEGVEVTGDKSFEKRSSDMRPRC